MAITPFMLSLNSFTTAISAQNNSDILSSNPPLFNTPYEKIYPACLAYGLPNNPTIYCNIARQHAIVDALCHNSVKQTCEVERGYSRQAMIAIANAVVREKTPLTQNFSLESNNTSR